MLVTLLGMVMEVDGCNGTEIGIPRGISFNFTNIGIILHCSGAGDGEDAGFGVKGPCEVVAAGAVVGFGNEGQTEQEHQSCQKKFVFHSVVWLIYGFVICYWFGLPFAFCVYPPFSIPIQSLYYPYSIPIVSV